MFLDVGNQFSIISPTHDFKLVTRLQHVTQAVRAAISVADNNRSWNKIGALFATCNGYMYIHVFSVCLFAECIENGHMPADLHGFMTMAPFKNMNPSVAVC